MQREQSNTDMFHALHNLLIIEIFGLRENCKTEGNVQNVWTDCRSGVECVVHQNTCNVHLNAYWAQYSSYWFVSVECVCYNLHFIWHVLSHVTYNTYNTIEHIVYCVGVYKLCVKRHTGEWTMWVNCKTLQRRMFRRRQRASGGTHREGNPVSEGMALPGEVRELRHSSFNLCTLLKGHKQKEAICVAKRFLLSSIWSHVILISLKDWSTILAYKIPPHG